MMFTAERAESFIEQISTYGSSERRVEDDLLATLGTGDGEPVSVLELLFIRSTTTTEQSLVFVLLRSCHGSTVPGRIKP